MRLNWRRPACRVRPRPSLRQVAPLVSLPLLLPGAAPAPARPAAKSALPARVGGRLLCRRSGGASWMSRTKAPTAASVSTAGASAAAPDALLPAVPTAAALTGCSAPGAASEAAPGAGLLGLRGEGAPSSSANGSTSAPYVQDREHSQTRGGHPASKPICNGGQRSAQPRELRYAQPACSPHQPRRRRQRPCRQKPPGIPAWEVAQHCKSTQSWTHGSAGGRRQHLLVRRRPWPAGRAGRLRA